MRTDLLLWTTKAIHHTATVGMGRGKGGRGLEGGRGPEEGEDGLREWPCAAGTGGTESLPTPGPLLLVRPNH